MYECYKCKKKHEIDEFGIEPDVYEYRGVYACESCFDDTVEMRDRERGNLIKNEDSRTRAFKGLDIYSDSSIGKANKEIFKGRLDACKKESYLMKEYEKK